MLKHKNKKKRTAPSDSAGVRKKPTVFDPNQDYIDSAVDDFKKNGGKITKVKYELGGLEGPL